MSCWASAGLVWMLNGLTSEGVQRMMQLWPLPPDLPAGVEADFCLGFARLNKDARREEHWEAARRAEALYRQLRRCGPARRMPSCSSRRSVR